MGTPDLRPIERGTFVDVPIPTSFGPAPQLQWIAVAKLVVDESYQRPLTSQGSRQNVRQIAAAFDWRRFAPVVVSPVAGGRYAIVDGQHRCTAALLVGIDEVPCNVILADAAEQARAFEAINAQVTKITSNQIFKAKLAHGDPEAARVQAVAAAAGVQVLTYHPSSLTLRPGQTAAVKCLTRMVQLHGVEVVTLALKVIRHNAGDLAGYLSTPIITAVTTVLADHAEWREAPNLFAAADQLDLEDAYTLARQRAAAKRGTTAQDQLQAILITHFSEALRS